MMKFEGMSRFCKKNVKCIRRSTCIDRGEGACFVWRNRLESRSISIRVLLNASRDTPDCRRVWVTFCLKWGCKIIGESPISDTDTSMKETFGSMLQ